MRTRIILCLAVLAVVIGTLAASATARNAHTCTSHCSVLFDPYYSGGYWYCGPVHWGDVESLQGGSVWYCDRQTGGGHTHYNWVLWYDGSDGSYAVDLN